MSKVDAFHTSESEDPQVYHNNGACHYGQAISRGNRVSGTGSGRTLCSECARLNREGK
jgi:hypothetical protein